MRVRLTQVALLMGLVGLVGLFAGAPARAVELRPFLSGLSSPLYLTHARDGSGRLFVVEQAGVIRVVLPGSTSTGVFLDIRSKVVAGGEQGLLGLTFHPLYALNGRFFVHYTRAGDGAIVISEFQRSADPNQAAVASERILLAIPHPTFTNHNGGMIEFGPDGLLYIAVGDGGSAFDPNNNAQNPNVLLGKILRIDVNVASGTLPYGIPLSNPFALGGGAPEIYALGLRNPFRFSFDRLSGALVAGDVGQREWEELDIIVAGGNYGWNALEGNHCTGRGPTACVPENFVPAVAEYFHSGGRCSVTGGYVYNGPGGSLPRGTYVFADFCTGEIFTLSGNTPLVLLDTPLQIASFGEDESGELYVVDLAGTVSRLTASRTDALHAFVLGLYGSLLGRSAAPAEVAGYGAFLSSHCNVGGFSAVIDSFVDSAEFRFLRPLTLEDQVSALYRGVLRRDADVPGLEGWKSVLRQTRLEIAVLGFANSQEFLFRVPASGDRAGVEGLLDSMFVQFLQRPADDIELEILGDFLLQTGDFASLIGAFVITPEFESRALTNRDFVTVLYRGVLGREPDAEGIDAWDSVLRATLISVANAFVGSVEFQSQAAALCR